MVEISSMRLILISGPVEGTGLDLLGERIFGCNSVDLEKIRPTTVIDRFTSKENAVSAVHFTKRTRHTTRH